MTRTRGAGSLRERGPGEWEARFALGSDLVSGRTVVRSLTVHGDRPAAGEARALLAAQAALVQATRRARPPPRRPRVEQIVDGWGAAECGQDRRQGAQDGQTGRAGPVVQDAYHRLPVAGAGSFQKRRGSPRSIGIPGERGLQEHSGE
jgi:hypothetical protein